VTIGDIIELAKSTELRQIAIKNDDKAILQLINLGVVEIHKRFQLKQKETIIQLVEGVSAYQMPEDFMWLISAYGEVPEGEVGQVELPVNVDSDPLSVNVIEFNKVQVPLVVDGEYISLIYVAQPEWITYDDGGEYKNKLVELPVQMIDSLLFYIGYKGNAILDNSHTPDEDIRLRRFLHSLDTVKYNGMINMSSVNMDDRIVTKGFV